MSTSANSINNQVGTAGTTTVLSHLRSAAGQWDSYNDQTDTFGFYSGVGSPEGVVTANTGSYYTDTGAAATGIYYKTTDAANTGWTLIQNSSLDVSFLVALTTAATNVTGAGGTYTLGTQGGGATTSVFDVGGNITTPAGVTTFTAPVTGKYWFRVDLNMDALAGGNTAGGANIVVAGTSARTYIGNSFNIGAVANPSTDSYLSCYCLADMTAGDTATVQAQVTGGGGDTVGVTASTTTVLISSFSGFLVSAVGGATGIFGPASSTSGAIATWNGTGGNLLADSGILVASGTWTPVLSFGGASVGITYSTQTGTYMRIGNMVTYTYFITLTSKGSSTGAAAISGFPITVAQSMRTVAAPTGLTIPAGGELFLDVPQAATTTSSLQSWDLTGGGVTSLTDANFSGTDTWLVNGSYSV